MHRQEIRADEYCELADENVSRFLRISGNLLTPSGDGGVPKQIGDASRIDVDQVYNEFLIDLGALPGNDFLKVSCLLLRRSMNESLSPAELVGATSEISLDRGCSMWRRTAPQVTISRGFTTPMPVPPVARAPAVCQEVCPACPTEGQLKRRAVPRHHGCPSNGWWRRPERSSSSPQATHWVASVKAGMAPGTGR